MDMTEEMFKKFSGLCSRLSPENLHCDGEISNAEAQRRYRIIIKEWRGLEKIVGRKVSEEETEGEQLRRYNIRSN